MNEDRIKNIVENIISRDEFQPEKVADLSWLDKIRQFLSRIISFILDIIDDILEKILKKLFSLFNFDSISIKNSSSVIKIIVYVLALLIVAFLVFVLIKIIIKIIKHFDKEKINSESFSEELISFVEEPQKPYDLAMLYFNEKNYRLSFRYLFLSLLINFNKKEIIEIHKSKTNRQYLYEIKYKNDNFYNISEGFFKAFDIIWYGGRILTLEEYSVWKEKYDDINEKLSLIVKEAKDE